jgi:pimeloyl-ACP methyl ester carboxylesterase
MKEYHLNSKIFYKKNKFNKNRKNILFIHGLSGSSSAWNPYEEHLKNKYNIISLDLRGHGKSFRPKDISDYEFKRFSEDIHNLLDKEKIREINIISHSLGSLIAIQFHKDYPKIVKSMLLVSPHYAPKQRKFSKLILPLIKMSKLIIFLDFREKLGQVDYKNYQNTGDWNLRRMYADIKNTGLRSFIYSTLQSYEVDYKNDIKNIRIPVKIVHGKKDTIFPVSDSLKIVKLIKNSKIIILDNADHIIVLNNFNELSKIIENFIKSE